MLSWKGYYEQYGQQQFMNFTNFQANPTPGAPIMGDGQDTVGKFVFSGSFSNDATMVRFKKQYI